METLIQRRHFLGMMGAALSTFALSGCELRHRAASPLTRAYPRHGEHLIPAVCGQCSAGCGIIARVVNRHVVKLEGNAMHPINRGALCAKAHAGLQLLYHPDRFRSPMLRTGPKGSGQWRKIGWNEAVDVVAGRLQLLRDRAEPQSLVVLDGRPNEVERMLWNRFCDAFGTPNYFPLENSGSDTAAHFLHGRPARLVYDLKSSNYILSFGCDLFDGECWSAEMKRIYGYLRQERPGARAKFVQLDRRFSNSAAKADEWIPVKPLTEGVLALAIARVIIDEGLYDRNFVGTKTVGFENFNSALFNEYSVDTAAIITGVPAETIIRIAREFGQNRPAVALSDSGVTSAPNGSNVALAIQTLNALVGSIDIPGGVSLGKNIGFGAMPPLTPDNTAERGRTSVRVLQGNAEALCDAICDSKPYPIRALFLRNADPISSFRISARFREALEAVPFVVSFSSFPGRSAEMADLILPDHVYLEKCLGAVSTSIAGEPAFTAAGPVIDPLYGTMQTEEFVLRVAHATEMSSLPWNTFREFLKSITLNTEGQSSGENVFTFHPEILMQANPLEGNNKTNSFFVNLLGIDNIHCAGPCLPWMRELDGGSDRQQPWGEISPRVAQDLGIQEGDDIWIETQRGKVCVRARLYEGAMPGVISVAAGAPGINDILSLECDRLTGSPAWSSTRAAVYKV